MSLKSRSLEELMIDGSSDSDSEAVDGDDATNGETEYDAMIDEICYHWEDVVHNRQARQAGWAIGEET